MKITGKFNNQKKLQDQKSGGKIYCTIDSVLQEVVYERQDNNNEYYYDNVVKTNQNKSLNQLALSAKPTLSKSVTETVTTTTTTPQEGTVTTTSTVTISPQLVFDYTNLVRSSSGSVERWKSSVKQNFLSQSTSGDRPSLGRFGGGVNGQAPLFFNAEEGDFMSLNSAVTLSGDFTMFFYLEPIANPEIKYVRLLGKSDDNDMFLSIGESANNTYVISFASGSGTEFASTSTYFQPSTSKLLITIQRSGNNIIIRENGVALTPVSSQAITNPTSDFVFDQVGKKGNRTDFFMNASLFHFSVYDGFIDSNLTRLEQSIIKNAEAAKGI